MRDMETPKPPRLALDHKITMIDVLRCWPQAGPALLAAGLPCMGCAMARFHTIADAASEHAMDEVALRQILIAVISG